MVKRIISIGVVLVILFSLFGCRSEPEYNTDAESGLYTLTEAYDLGLLKRADIMDIAFYRNGVVRNGKSKEIAHTPRPKTPEVLSDKTVENIIQAELKRGGRLEASSLQYYGTYNNCVVMMTFPTNASYTQALWAEVVADIMFNYSNGNRVWVWKE